jgi:hypothetical protein
MNCDHIYKNSAVGQCDSCGRPTHDMDWEYQNHLNRQWKLDNPNTTYGGWWSI